MRTTIAVTVLAFLGLTSCGPAGKQEAKPTPPNPSPRWAKEPTTYRGVAWGASKEQASAKGIPCTYPPAGAKEVPDTWLCFAEPTVEGVALNESWRFEKDKMVGVLTTFESD